MTMDHFFDSAIDEFDDGKEISASNTFYEEDEYDAINDETFGGELNDVEGDLEEFANRTAGLLLDEPSCSSKHSTMKIPNRTWLEGEVVLGAKTLEELEQAHLSLAVDNPNQVVAQAAYAELSPSRLPSFSFGAAGGGKSSGGVWDKVSVQPSGLPTNVPLNFVHPPPNIRGTFPQRPFPSRVPYNSSMPRVPGSWIFNSNKTTNIQNGISSSSSFSPYSQRGQFNVPPQQRGHRRPPYSMQQSNHSYYGYSSQGNNNNNFSGSSDNYNYQHDQQQRHGSTSSPSINASMVSSNDNSNSRQNRHKGLPSCKTISDFAFDPYAGFMSKKEREWLIKIHLIQCMSTGEPIEDDFYYTMWKKRNVLRRPAHTFKMRPHYYSFEDTYPSTTYVPPSFVGSLGKPSHCNAKIPRQLLDFPVDCVDDEAGRNSQKKLKAMLMRIENATMLLIECDVLKRKSVEMLSAEELNELNAKLKERVESMMLLVCGEDFLPMVMMIQKGRTLLLRLLDFCAITDAFNIFKTIIETLPKYCKKIPDNSVIEISKHIYVFLSTLSKGQLTEIMKLFVFEADAISSVKLVFVTAFTLLFALAKFKTPLSEITESSTYTWLISLSSKNGMQESDVYTLLMTSNLEEIFSTEELLFLKHWLQAELSQSCSGAAELLTETVEKLISSNGNISNQNSAV